MEEFLEYNVMSRLSTEAARRSSSCALYEFDASRGFRGKEALLDGVTARMP
jgi:hypothetical protein